MIITILPSSSNFHGISYNEHKVGTGDASLILMKDFPERLQRQHDINSLTKYITNYTYARNDRISKAQFHVAVSCKAHENTPKEIFEFGMQYLEKMGYLNDGQPLLAYLHTDTANTHIHFITSRIAPDGHKISHAYERVRSRQIINELTGKMANARFNNSIREAASYRFYSLSGYKAIMESQGYQCYQKPDDETSIYFARDGVEQGAMDVAHIEQLKALALSEEDRRRARQLKFIFQKYRDRTPDKGALEELLHRNFGVSLVFIGSKDSPYGYFVVDRKTRVVFKGSDIIPIKKLLEFKSTEQLEIEINKYMADMQRGGKRISPDRLTLLLSHRFGLTLNENTQMYQWGNARMTLSIPDGLLFDPDNPRSNISQTVRNYIPPHSGTRREKRFGKYADSGEKRDWEISSDSDMDEDDRLRYK